MQFFSVYYISPVYTIPDYLSYVINFRSEVKNKGVYITLSLRTVPSTPWWKDNRLRPFVTNVRRLGQGIVNRGEGLEAGGVAKLCYCSLSRDNTGASKSI